MTDPIAKHRHVRLPHGEVDERKRYIMPDPDSMAPATRAVYGWIHYNEPMPSRTELQCVVSMAQTFVHLTTYELGQEHCVGQLRDIWRARRAGKTGAND